MGKKEKDAIASLLQKELAPLSSAVTSLQNYVSNLALQVGKGLQALCKIDIAGALGSKIDIAGALQSQQKQKQWGSKIDIAEVKTVGASLQRRQVWQGRGEEEGGQRRRRQVWQGRGEEEGGQRRRRQVWQGRGEEE